MSFPLDIIATIVDVLGAMFCVLAMQTIARLDTVPHIGLIHAQRFTFGALGFCLMWNGLANPSVSWFGEHHLSGFCIDVAILAVVMVYVYRGYLARRSRPRERVEFLKQPFDYFLDLFNGLLDPHRHKR
jgi:hypothetical protein